VTQRCVGTMVKRSRKNKPSLATLGPIAFPEYVHALYASLASSGAGQLGPLSACFEQLQAASSLRAQIKIVSQCRAQMLVHARAVVAGRTSLHEEGAGEAPTLCFASVIRLLVVLAVPEVCRKLRTQLLAMVDMLYRSTSGVADLHSECATTLASLVYEALDGTLIPTLPEQCSALCVRCGGSVCRPQWLRDLAWFALHRGCGGLFLVPTGRRRRMWCVVSPVYL